MRLPLYKVGYWPDPHTDPQYMVRACVPGAFLEWEWTLICVAIFSRILIKSELLTLGIMPAA